MFLKNHTHGRPAPLLLPVIRNAVYPVGDVDYETLSGELLSL